MFVMGIGGRVQAQTFSFASADDLSGWQSEGEVAVDPAQARDGKPSLRVMPGAMLRKQLRDHDGAGSVSFWILDEGGNPANPKAKHAGPRWGVAQADGHALVVGHLYAPYLNGAETFATGEAKIGAPPVEWANTVQYLGVRRTPGVWQKWTFHFDPEKGLILSLNDKPISRFDWNRTRIGGMSQIVLLGDAAKEGGQTLWVSQVQAELGGAMTARPTPPPPPPPVVPESDPQPTRQIKLREGLAGVHPRVLFTREQIPALRQRYQQDTVAREKLENYVRACNPFTDPKFLKDATDGQRQGLWQMPTLALHWVLTENPTSRDKAIEFLRRLVELEDWEVGSERNSGMSAGNIMIGAGMTYDLLYHELPADLREKAAAKLLYHSRAMIHGGHLKKNKGTHYWQNDPANNHRWHRNGGLAMALLAVYEEQPEAQWAAEFLVNELDFIHKWLPADGSNHEGPGYLIFGLPHLVLSFQAADRVLGTSYLKHDYFASAPWFLFHAMRPGLTDFMPYGDTGGLGFYFGALYAGASEHQDAAAIVALDRLRQTNPRAFAYSWMDLLWRDGTLVKEQITYTLPKIGRYADLGITYVRDSCDDDAVAAMFKCGPLGGEHLNRFRESVTPYQYINVAHCDPDANSFIIAIGPELVAETSRYSYSKRSSSHNTILVNGSGQYARGRQEGVQWSQPATGNQSMLDDARVVAWNQLDPQTLLIEGEAAGSYPAARGQRPQIERFRRLFLWKEGAYVLVLDDIRSPEPVQITWLMQGPKLEAAGEGRFFLIADQARCAFQLVSDGSFRTEIGASTADNRKQPLGWQQLQATTDKVEAVRFASVYTPWGGEAQVTLETQGDRAIVTVRHAGGVDRWTWQFAKDAQSPATFTPAR